MVKALAFPANVKLVCKYWTMTNTLAYCVVVIAHAEATNWDSYGESVGLP